MRISDWSSDVCSSDLDLHAWAEQFFEEMTSDPGTAMVRDVIGSTAQGGWQSQCSGYTRSPIQIILDHAARRGEPAPDVWPIMDRFVSPFMYRSLFLRVLLSPAGYLTLIDSILYQHPDILQY